nr:hypothetical protein [Tanacetum cinerariifolium]
MALPVQNINHLAFRLMFEREKLSVYDAYNEVACLILGSMTPKLHRQFENSSPYENSKPSAKECPSKDDAYHHCKEVGHWKQNCHVYLAELITKKKQVGTASSSGARKLKQGALYLYVDYDIRAQVEAIGISNNDVLYFNAISSNGIYEIDMINRVSNVNSIYTVSNKRAKHNLDSTYLWHCRLAHISKKRIEKLQHDGLLKSTDEESFDKCVSCLSDMCQDRVLATSLPLRMIIVVQGCKALVKRDTFNKLQQRSVKCIFIGYPKETMGYYFYFPPENKIVVASEIPMEVEGLEPPQEEVVPIRRAIRILIPITAFYDYEIWQMDIKTAFLNGYLDEDIYMVQHEGFTDPKHPKKVCKLQKSIYGLKQASRSWNKRFDKEIKSLQSVTSHLGKCFATKDLGETTFILGIKIYRDRSKRLIGLSQSAYINKILKRYRMDNSKRGNIPMQEKLDLNKTQGALTPEEVKRMQNVPYALAVGSIMYAVRCPIIDVAFAQNITSRFQQNSGELHWTVVKTILKYLRNIKDMFLVYGGNPEA